MYTVSFVVGAEKHRHAIEPIADEAEKRGHEVIITSKDATLETDILFTINPAYYTASMSTDLSVTMFDGVDDAYTEYVWESTDWRAFDIGLLPGQASAEIWKQKSHMPQTRPNLGVYKVGWPKSDWVFTEEFETGVTTCQNELELDTGGTVIYAPTSEGHGKIHEFVESALAVADNVLIKHAPYEVGEYLVDETLEEIYAKYEDMDDVYILDKNEDIFLQLAVSDILVSDESSVLQEAPLTETVPVSVTNWPIREASGDVLPYEQIPSFAVETSRQELQTTLEEVFEDLDNHVHNVEQQKDDHYANLGHSSEVVMDLVEAVIEGAKPPTEPIESRPLHPVKYRLRLAKFKFDRLATDAVLNRLPSETRYRLKRSSLGKWYQNLFRS